MSLYQRLHEVQRSESAEFGRDPVLDELRQRVHHLLIDEVGPLLYDRRIGEDELRRQLRSTSRSSSAGRRCRCRPPTGRS